MAFWIYTYKMDFMFWLQDFAADAKLTRQSVAHGREHMQVHLRIRPFTATERDKGEYQVGRFLIYSSNKIWKI